MKMRNKIVSLLLAAVLIVGLFSACAKEDGPVWEWDRVMTSEFLAEIKNAGRPMDEYYGTYNGWVVYGVYRSGNDSVSVPTDRDTYTAINLSSEMKWANEVAGYYFINFPQIFVYRDGACYRLKQAYEDEQILTKEQIGYIHGYHMELHPAEYAESADIFAEMEQY